MKKNINNWKKIIILNIICNSFILFYYNTLNNKNSQNNINDRTDIIKNSIKLNNFYKNHISDNRIDIINFITKTFNMKNNKINDNILSDYINKYLDFIEKYKNINTYTTNKYYNLIDGNVMKQIIDKILINNISQESNISSKVNKNPVYLN